MGGSHQPSVLCAEQLLPGLLWDEEVVSGAGGGQTVPPCSPCSTSLEKERMGFLRRGPADGQGVHMGRTRSPPGGMDLERQAVEMAPLPLSPVMYEARPFTQELPPGVAAMERHCLLPCPGALTHPALDCCWATTPLMALFTNSSSRPVPLPLQFLCCPSVLPPFPAARQI